MVRRRLAGQRKFGRTTYWISGLTCQTVGEARREARRIRRLGGAARVVIHHRKACPATVYGTATVKRRILEA